MKIPEYVSRNRVTAHSLSHPDAVTPVLFRYAGGVHLTADDLEWLAVKKKMLFTKSKCMSAFLCTALIRPGEQCQGRKYQARDYIPEIHTVLINYVIAAEVSNLAFIPSREYLLPELLLFPD
jgi:hypothetical protein